VVPHSHRGDVSYSNEAVNFESADSFLDIVKIAFLVDLGEGHMDNYHSSDGLADYSFDFTIDLFQQIPNCLLSTIELDDVVIEKQIFFRESMHPPRIHLDTYTLRGPPSYTIG